MGLFDGLTGILADVFGDTVTLTPVSGPALTLTAVLRLEPIEVPAAEGGSVLLHTPTLRVRLTDAPNIGHGDLVNAATDPSVTYAVVNIWPSRSPAADRFVVCELEVVPT